MKSASLSEIKKALEKQERNELSELILRLAKYKKENKELIDYLLFSSHNENEYIENVKDEIKNQFKLINKTNIYFAKKSIRKALRIANKFIRYSGKKETETELLIYFCIQMRNSGVDYENSIAMNNLYNRQIIRIEKAIASMHEDLQYDYNKELNKLKPAGNTRGIINRLFKKQEK